MVLLFFKSREVFFSDNPITCGIFKNKHSELDRI